MTKISLRLRLFWLKRILGNNFTPAYVFGKHRKLGQTEINFRVDCKITLLTRKTISGFILPSNDFHPRKIEERERNSKKRSHQKQPQTTPNPKLHRSLHTLAPMRLRHLKHCWDHAAWSAAEIVPPIAPLRSHLSTGKIAPIVAIGSSSVPPSRSLPPKTDPPKTDLVLDPLKIELVLDTPILFSLLLNVADLAATDNQPTPLHPQTHPMWPPPSSIHSDLSLSRSISPSLNLSLFLPPISLFLPLAQCFYFDFWLSVYLEIFCNKICLDVEKMVEKMWKICRNIAFLECYQTPKIVFRTIFYYRTKHPDFIFLTGIHFPLRSFYTQNSIYIEPNAALVTNPLKLPTETQTKAKT